MTYDAILDEGITIPNQSGIYIFQTAHSYNIQGLNKNNFHSFCLKCFNKNNVNQKGLFQQQIITFTLDLDK